MNFQNLVRLPLGTNEPRCMFQGWNAVKRPSYVQCRQMRVWEEGRRSLSACDRGVVVSWCRGVVMLPRRAISEFLSLCCSGGEWNSGSSLFMMARLHISRGPMSCPEPSWIFAILQSGHGKATVSGWRGLDKAEPTGIDICIEYEVFVEIQNASKMTS